MTLDMYIRMMDAIHKISSKYCKVPANETKEVNFHSFRLRFRHGIYEVLTKHGIIMVAHPKEKLISETVFSEYHSVSRCHIADSQFSVPNISWVTIMDEQRKYNFDFSYFKKGIGSMDEHEDLSGCADMDDIEARTFQYSLHGDNEIEFSLACMLSSGLYKMPFNEVAFRRYSHLGSTEESFRLILEEIG